MTQIEMRPNRSRDMYLLQSPFKKGVVRDSGPGDVRTRPDTLRPTVLHSDASGLRRGGMERVTTDHADYADGILGNEGGLVDGTSVWEQIQ